MNIEGNVADLIKEENPEFLKAFRVSDNSVLTLNGLKTLYFNENNIKRESLANFLDIKRDPANVVKEKYNNLALPENRDANYELPVEDSVYNLKQGDLILLGSDTELNMGKKGSKDAYYSIFLDYFINGEGKYVVKSLSMNSTFPEQTVLESANVSTRKQSIENKFPETEIDSKAKYTTLKLSKDLFFNSKLLFSMIKPGDKLTIGTSDYTVLNAKGAIFVTKNSKGEYFEIKPTTKVSSIKLSHDVHKNLDYDKENILKNFKESPIKNIHDKDYIKENDLVKYGDNLGLVLYKFKSTAYVKNLDNGAIETVFLPNITQHFINNVGNAELINNLSNNKGKLVDFNPFNYGDYLESDYN